MPNDLVQPAHLLDISNFDGSQRANPTFDTSNPNWPSKVVGGHTFDGSKAYKFEWVSILNPNEEQDDEVGVTGTVLKPELSGADLPFTHPFGSDFEFTIVPDPAYEGLLARANKDPNGVYARSWTAAARTAGIAIPTGVLGLEIDAALVPPDYRPAHGDRVAVYGRWIVDAGHPEFHTEIHPPLLMARARTIDSSGNPVTPSASATTFFQVWSRPYQAGQLFATGGDTGILSAFTLRGSRRRWGRPGLSARLRHTFPGHSSCLVHHPPTGSRPADDDSADATVANGANGATAMQLSLHRQWLMWSGSDSLSLASGTELCPRDPCAQFGFLPDIARASLPIRPVLHPGPATPSSLRR